MSRNVAASVRARLKNRADLSAQDFNLTLTKFGLERLLYRLSISRHANHYLLKGALLFSLWYQQPHRPTRDADLLGYGPDDIESAIAAFREICSVDADDGLNFDLASIAGSEIRKDSGYGGVRIDLRATLDGARIPLQVDIGFGDAVTPGPVSIRYPVLLDDLPAPLLRAYPKHIVIAEKLHAICLLGMVNTRMKDYFDLWILLSDAELDPAQAREAVLATFDRRRMPLPDGTPLGVSEAFATDTQKRSQWTAFLTRNHLQPVELKLVVALIRRSFETMLQPI